MHYTKCISPQLSNEFESRGILSSCETFGSDALSELLYRILPPHIATKIESRLMIPFLCRRWLSKVKQGDFVWVYTTGRLVNPMKDTWIELAIKRRKAKYIFQIPDAWPELTGPLKDACERRVYLSDLTVAVTPALRDMIRERFPGVRCETAEEAVDTDSVFPVRNEEFQREKVLLWSGPPGKTDLNELKNVLESVHKKHPFVLRIVSGFEKPQFSFSFPWEWVPFSNATQNNAFAGVSAAIAYYGDSAYDLCKGNYKVKKYMAAGLPIVTSDVGYNRILIKNSVNGLLVKNTPKGWEEALVKVLSNPPKAEKMGIEARRVAVERYSYKAVAIKYQKVLEKHFGDLFSI